MMTASTTTLYNSAINTRFPNPSLNLQSCHNATKILSLKNPPPLIKKHPLLRYSHHHQKKPTSGAINFRSLEINASSSSSSLAASTKTKPFSVLFVCLGNICRSPAAEGVFTDIVKTRGLDSEFKIDSAGTIDYHEGNPADPRMRAASKRRGVEITSISRPIRPSDFRDFDIILAMDKQNREDIMEAFNRWKFREPLPDDAHKKVKLMCSFCKKHDETEVPDPYYGGPQGFEKTFIDEVMELVELKPLMNALVGLPRIDGLSTEQRKRLTIAVELVANPSIIFMDEPTSGLDARAAAIVMRAIRHMVDTGRTVVCTIHQPSIDIFETFDELLLMKRGGQVIYAGPLGHNSHKLVQYFEAVPGVPRIKQGSNPATWMLEISSEAIEAQLQVDFAEVYANSELYRKNQELVKKLSTPRPGSKDLSFPSQYPQSFITQCTACFWKQHKSYWRNSEFNYTRFVVAIIIGILFGLVFWSKGDRIYRRNDLINLLGAAYATVLFLGATNASAVQSVIATERTVFYRERAAGMYSELPYAFAHVAIEIVYVSIQTFLYSLLLYSTIGFEWNVSKFLYFYYFIFMSFTYFSMYGMMIISLTPGPEIAAVVMSFFISFWNLFSGYLITRPLIPVWWRWYYWASPVAWTIYGIFTSQVGDKNTLLEIPESEPVPLKAFVERYLGYDQEFLLPVVLAHVGWVLLFFFIFAYGIKFLNFQRR